MAMITIDVDFPTEFDIAGIDQESIKQSIADLLGLETEMIRTVDIREVPLGRELGRETTITEEPLPEEEVEVVGETARKRLEETLEEQA